MCKIINICLYIYIVSFICFVLKKRSISNKLSFFLNKNIFITNELLSLKFVNFLGIVLILITNQLSNQNDKNIKVSYIKITTNNILNRKIYIRKSILILLLVPLKLNYMSIILKMELNVYLQRKGKSVLFLSTRASGMVEKVLKELYKL